MCKLCTMGEMVIMKIKKLSVLLASLLFVSAFCMAGCGASSQAPEAFAVSIYKVEKEQDEDGKVYITNYDLWKSYNVTPTQAIDLPDYDPEKEDKDCKVLYKGNYDYSRDNISGEINGKVLACKNKIQFIPNANSIIFARERKKKTINFFYDGKNIKESLSLTEIEQFYNIFKDTYEESFTLGLFREWLKTFFTGSMEMTEGQTYGDYYDYYKTINVTLYTKNNGEKTFCQYSITKYKSKYQDEYRYDYQGGSFTLIKSTDVYLKVEA